MRKLFLLVSFSIATPFVLLFSVVFLSFLSFQKNPNPSFISVFVPVKTVSYAALPTAANILDEEIVEKDARVEIVRQFFAQYNSPLEPFAPEIIQKAEIYGLDYRLLPAIAMQESNLCKKAPAGSYNCWGFGIWGGRVTKFSGYSEAIETVTKTLAKQYKTKGLETPEEIVKKYTPSDNGTWSYSVSHFMEQLR